MVVAFFNFIKMSLGLKIENFQMTQIPQKIILIQKTTTKNNTNNLDMTPPGGFLGLDRKTATGCIPLDTACSKQKVYIPFLRCSNPYSPTRFMNQSDNIGADITSSLAGYAPHPGIDPCFLFNFLLNLSGGTMDDQQYSNLKTSPSHNWQQESNQ